MSTSSLSWHQGWSPSSEAEGPLQEEGVKGGSANCRAGVSPWRGAGCSARQLGRKSRAVRLWDHPGHVLTRGVGHLAEGSRQCPSAGLGACGLSLRGPGGEARGDTGSGWPRAGDLAQFVGRASPQCPPPYETKLPAALEAVLAGTCGLGRVSELGLELTGVQAAAGAEV